MATSSDRKIVTELLSPKRGTDRDSLVENERTKAFTVAIYDEYFPKHGNEPFLGGKLVKKISDRFVRGVFDAGEKLENRNMSDKEVVGSRLVSLGYVEVMGHPKYKVRITEAGSRRAEELIASVRT